MQPILHFWILPNCAKNKETKIFNLTIFNFDNMICNLRDAH